MKRLSTFLLTAIATLNVMATDYTDHLLVMVNGEGSEQQATISVTEHDGLYDLNLRNFILMNGDEPMPVGNVELTGIVPQRKGEAIVLHAAQNIVVTEGDAEGVLFWMGPMLGELPVNVVAIVEDDQLRALITLDLMDMLQQMVEVRFGEAMLSGKGYHIPNGDFEAWHTSTGSYVEPNAWHSFESASGLLAALAGHHIEKSDKGRDGSVCARIFATSIFGIVANGTMTTGRMNAGAMVANDPNNNAYLDMSATDVDGNGDPFYVSLTSHPDSLAFWVKFNQGTTNASHPYATVSAVITDGTYYQDPEDKEYTNVVAKAANHEIAITGDDWRRISMPFNYVSESVQPKAILVTISTNADAGQGSSNDEVLVDDLTLIYNARLASLNVDGFAPDKFSYELDADVDLQPVADSRDAFVVKSEQPTAEGHQVLLTVYAADLLSSNTYTININNGGNGIADMPAVGRTAAESFFTLGGQQILTPVSGHVYVVRRSDGSTAKVMF
ncbi:MAG: PCMD domain-containing protein [Prevotella sp.]|nr:PCMD domain-containing protein [Prevotella sp.]